MWNSIKIDENVYYLRQTLEGNVFTLQLSNMVDIWSEQLTQEKLVERFKEHNPLVNAPQDKLVMFVLKILEPDNVNTTKDIVHSESGFQVKLVTKRSPANIYFSFVLEKGSAEMFYRAITLPILLMVNELNYRERKLFELLQAKDKEITEYKLEGATITRRNTTTEKFEINSFVKDCDGDIQRRTKETADDIRGVITPQFTSLSLKISKACGLWNTVEGVGQDENSALLTPKVEVSSNEHENKVEEQKKKVTLLNLKRLATREPPPTRKKRGKIIHI